MIAKITQDEIDTAFNSHHKTYEGRKEDYFGLLFISKKFNLTLQDAAQYLAFWGNDYGLDGFFFEEEKRNLHLFQFKWSTNHSLFRDSFHRLIDSGVEQIFGDAYQDRQENQMLTKLKYCLKENREVINQIFVHFVFNGDHKKAEQSKVLNSLREDLESKAVHIINNYFGREIGFIFNYVSNEFRSISNFIQKKKANKYSIECDSPPLIFNKNKEDKQLIITFSPINKFLEMYSDLQDSLFSKNIRSGLGEGKATNKEIKKSLKNMLCGEEPRENFTFFHNGISVTAEELNYDVQSKLITLIEPRVLNGAQTIQTLRNFVESNTADSRINELLKDIRIMVRLIKSNDPAFLTEVTINNNRQNPIMPWNLRANDEIQLSFEDKFRDDLKLYYERRENAFENLKSSELEDLGIDENKPIEITKFAQTLLAIQGEIDKMSWIREIFENENYYKQIFKEKLLEKDTRLFVLFYKIHYRLGSIKDEITSRGENKYFYVSRATNLLWALLIQAILNDANFNQYKERYGSSLTMEGDYNNLLKDIASKKIRLIFKKTFRKGKYQDYMDNEKYSFLRSKQTYDDCMETARKLYRWKKCII